MERIEFFAEMAVRRALSFAGLGIATTMLGFMFDPVLSLKAGAILVGLVAVVLAYKGYHAPSRPYRRTELWLLLDHRHGLPEDRAQAVIGGLLRRIYWRYAERAGYMAGGLWVLSLLAGLASL